VEVEVVVAVDLIGVDADALREEAGGLRAGVLAVVWGLEDVVDVLLGVTMTAGEDVVFREGTCCLFEVMSEQEVAGVSMGPT